VGRGCWDGSGGEAQELQLLQQLRGRRKSGIQGERRGQAVGREGERDTALVAR
jgi:hypothetical protein